MGGLSIWHWLILLVVLALLFGGTKRLRNIGEDVSAAIKSFRKGMQDDDNNDRQPQQQLKADPPPAAQPAPSERKPDHAE